jgi:hypothetical protein
MIDTVFPIIFLVVIGILVMFVIGSIGKSKTVNEGAAFVESQMTKVKKYANQNVTKSYLTGSSWNLINLNSNDEILYNFKSNDDLYITTNGIVKKCRYEFIVDSKSVLITVDDVMEHYNILNMKDNFFFLKRLSTNQLYAFVNQTKYYDKANLELKRLQSGS